MTPETDHYPAVVPLSSFSQTTSLGQNASTQTFELLADPATLAIAAAVVTVVLGVAVVAAFVARGGGALGGLPVWPTKVTDHLEATRAHDELGDVFLAAGFSGEPCVFVRGEHAPKVLCQMGSGNGKWTAPVGAKRSGFIVPSNLVQPMVAPTFFHIVGSAWKAARTALRCVFVPKPHTAAATVAAADRVLGAAVPADAKHATIDAQAVVHAVLRDTMFVAGVGQDATEATVAEAAFQELEDAANDWRADDTIEHAKRLSPRVGEASDAALDACDAATDAAIRRAASGDERAVRSVAAMLHASLVASGTTDAAARTEASRTVFNLVVAGAESNAISTAKTLAAIARDPELVAQLQAELDAAAAQSGDAADAAAARGASVPLLSAAVKEGLRLYTPATAALRVPDQDYRVTDGITIPAGTNVCVCFHALHHDASVWPRPARFDPSRFLGARVSRPRHAFLPFSAGPRKCPGEAVAMQQARVVIASVLSRFTPVADAPVPSAHAAGFTEWSATGIPVALTARG